MISYIKETPDPARPWLFARGFLTADTNDVARLSRGICKLVWSGIVWKDGVRREANFLFSDWCVFDFDTHEYSLAQALKDFCDCIHVIGTTKSHQVAKGNSPACDRFRVMIPWERRIEDLATYRFNMRRLAWAYPMDPQCRDGARFFFPCREVVSVVGDGYVQEVKPAPQVVPKWPERPKGTLSPWTKARLTGAIKVGERNSTYWGIAKDLLKAGFSLDKALEIIQGCPTNQDPRSAMPDKELASIIKSASKSVNKEAEDGAED